MSLPHKKERLLSLDAFRGAVIALIVLVNNADGDYVYHPLAHSRWNGWTLTDTVFPSFLWIIGVAITLSFRSRLDSGVPRSALFGHVLRRAAILYALGLFIYAFPHFDFSTQRILGVLQRIAICYVIASAIYLNTTWRGQMVTIVSLLSAYWLMMKLIPVPNYGAGHLDGANNLAHYIDRFVLGRHNYAAQRPGPRRHDQHAARDCDNAVWRASRKPFTPESGTFRTGSLAADFRQSAYWSGLFCDMWLPINKKLWTTSFCLFMAGLDIVLFAIFVWLIDALDYRRIVKPFVLIGMNAIWVYVLSELLAETLDAIHRQAGGQAIQLKGWIYTRAFAPFASPYNASLLYAIAYTLLMYVVAYGMYRRKWFLKV